MNTIETILNVILRYFYKDRTFTCTFFDHQDNNLLSEVITYRTPIEISWWLKGLQKASKELEKRQSQCIPKYVITFNQ